MKKTLAFLAATLVATAAYASCRYFTYTVDGRTYYCTECCYGEGPLRTCNTNCH